MQAAALNNPATAKMVSTAAKPPAPAGGDFGTTLATAISSVTPEHTPAASRTKAAVQPNRKLDPGSDAKPLCQSSPEPAGKPAVKTDPKSNAASDSQPVGKSGAKTESDPKTKPDDPADNRQPASNTTPSAQSSGQPTPLSLVVSTPPPPGALPVAVPAETAASAAILVPDNLSCSPPMGPVLAPGGAPANAATAGASIPSSETNFSAPSIVAVPGDLRGAAAQANPATSEYLDFGQSQANYTAQQHPASKHEATFGEPCSQRSILTAQTLEALSPPSLPNVLADVATAASPEGTASQAASMDSRFTSRKDSPAGLNAPAQSGHPFHPATSSLPASVSVFSLQSPQAAPAVPVLGATSSAADDQEPTVAPLAQGPDHPDSSAPARPPAPVAQDPVSVAILSRGTGKPPHQDSATPGPTWLSVSALPPSATPDQSALAPSNIPVNLSATSPTSAQTPAEEGEIDPKPSPEPAAGGQKKNSAPVSSDASPSRDVVCKAVFDSGGAAAALASPNSIEPAATPQTKAGQVPELPKTQQMLDSAPSPPPLAFPNGRFTPALAADMQMHVGIRTTAFGAVEIHTTIVQNEVGISVHGDRSLAHWFSSEVPNLESGLKDHSMSLADLHFDNGRSGVQTATSFQEGSPHRGFSQSAASPGTFEDSGAASETSPIDSLPLDLSTNPAGTRVSILV